MIEIQQISEKDALKSCKKWHYSKSCPPTIVPYGVWENKKYIGCIIFGRGASYKLGKKLGFDPKVCCELVRVALSGKQNFHTTKYLSLAIKFFKENNKNIQCIISFSDLEQDHIGILYQAGNWIYTGESITPYAYFDANGKRYHTRSLRVKNEKNNITFSNIRVYRKKIKNKYRYAYPLSKSARKKLNKFAKPYPTMRDGNGAN